ncbi:hypothetical protein M408DRAFT_326987 [Serendipita vermifera MAFF 305830]|uniref:CENP-C homolog n=1 Tax=Serendipita vermifera MAFF 305830 TaxID=933852 RepID=A0A0C3B6F4_SERVB|nr:hypothetical protein M408DRAFT_326987 [Serendipita vermifera MAFF 305830]
MLRTGTTAAAQRKGGPRSRSHNDDRFKGTLTGVAIPEARRGSDGIEDFENLLENNYDQNKPSQNLRNTAARGTNGASKSTAPHSARSNDDFVERSVPNRSRPPSTIGPSTSRALQGVDVDYTSVPSPRINPARLGYGPLVSNYQNRSPAYDRSSALGFSAHRPNRTFSGLSENHDDEEDAEKIMDQYVDFNGGVQAYQDSVSPPPQEHSSPPQVSKKLVHSPVVNRSAAKPKEPTPAERAVESSPAVTVSRQVKGKQRATEEPEVPPTPAPIKLNGKRHANLTDDEGDQDAPLVPRKPRSARVSNDSAAGTASAKSKAIRNPEPPDEVQPDDNQFDEPQFDDNGGDNFGQDYADEEPAPNDEPPATASEQSEGESESALKKAAKKSKKEKPASKKAKGTEAEKKRRRNVDDDPPRQTKKPRADSAKPSSRARSKTPVEPDKSWLEPLESPSEDEEEEDDAGVRRSRRAKIAPVKFWLGEKLEYETWQAGSDRQVPTILGVRRVPEAPAASLSRKKKKSKQKTRSKSRRLETDESRPQSIVRVETGWDDDTVPSALVLDFDTNEEVEKMIAFTAGMVVPKLTDRGHFFYQRIFNDERYVAAGHIVIPPKGEKPKKSAKDNTFVFYLIEGAIQVMVHEAKFYLAAGGMFMVPRGNTYYIRNMQDYDAKLFFVQGRRMTAEELEMYRDTPERETASPGRSRYMYSDEIGASGRRQRSSSRGEARSSSPRKAAGTSKPVASTSTVRRR